MSTASVRTVSEYMTKDFVHVPAKMDTYDATAHLLKHHVSAMPVVDESGKLVGILSERDLLEAFVQAEYYESPPAFVEDLMTKEVVSVVPDTGIIEAAKIFSETRFHHLPILEGEKVVGQISRRTVLRAVRKMQHVK